MRSLRERKSEKEHKTSYSEFNNALKWVFLGTLFVVFSQEHIFQWTALQKAEGEMEPRSLSREILVHVAQRLQDWTLFGKMLFNNSIFPAWEYNSFARFIWETWSEFLSTEISSWLRGFEAILFENMPPFETAKLSYLCSFGNLRWLLLWESLNVHLFLVVSPFFSYSFLWWKRNLR